MTATCTATRRDGAACRAPALPPSAWCWAHDPDRAAERHRARQSGGHGRSTTSRSLKHLPPELRGIWQTLVDLVDEVRSGTATPQVATAVAALAARLLDYAQYARESGELAELGQRLEALEAEQQHGRQQRWR